jgi:hypothetical protein
MAWASKERRTVREGLELRRERYSRSVQMDIAAPLRSTSDVGKRSPQSLLAALADLERRLRDAERDRLYAEVDRRIDELLHAAR